MVDWPETIRVRDAAPMALRGKVVPVHVHMVVVVVVVISVAVVAAMAVAVAAAVTPVEPFSQTVKE